MSRIRVKICGLTRRQDVRDAVDAGADAVGFVFADSPRRVDPETARSLVRLLPPFVMAVGVFRDHAPMEVNSIAESVGLHLVQLHGEESPDSLNAIRFPILKRIVVREPVDRARIERMIQEYAGVTAFLLDPGAGDGLTFSWKQVAGLNAQWVLAGGLRPENVGAAIRLSRPSGVDVSSGVERIPGIKSKDAMARFVRAVREADDDRSST